MPYIHKLDHDGAFEMPPRIDLPLIKNLQSEPAILENIPLEILQAVGLREFYKLSLEHSLKIILEFRKISGDIEA